MKSSLLLSTLCFIILQRMWQALDWKHIGSGNENLECTQSVTTMVYGEFTRRRSLAGNKNGELRHETRLNNLINFNSSLEMLWWSRGLLKYQGIGWLLFVFYLSACRGSSASDLDLF